MDIEENLSLKNEIKNAAIEVGSTSTCHGKKKKNWSFCRISKLYVLIHNLGVPNIIRTKLKIIKLIWFICMLCSFSYCSNLIYESILEYINYETVTDTEIIYQNPTEFPSNIVKTK